jgi:hypothetical protein
VTFAQAGAISPTCDSPLNTVCDAIVATYPPGVGRARRLRRLRRLWRLALEDPRLRQRGGDPRDRDLILRLISDEIVRDIRLSGRKAVP